MHIISWKKLSDFIEDYPTSESSLRSWHKIIRESDFSNFNELKMTFRTIDQVGNLTVFNINGNYFRLIAAIHYNRQKVYVRDILTHTEYDKNKWKEK